MGFKFNPLTGRLDLVEHSNTTGPTTTTIAIPAGQTVTVDSVLYSSIKSINYFVNLIKDDFTKVKSLKMTVLKINSDVRDTVYARFGNDLNCSISSLVVGSNADLIVTNNEAFDITCSFNKETIN